MLNIETYLRLLKHFTCHVAMSYIQMYIKTIKSISEILDSTNDKTV